MTTLAADFNAAREARRTEALAEYRKIMARVEKPNATDASRLAEAAIALELNDAEVSADLEAAATLFRLRREAAVGVIEGPKIDAAATAQMAANVAQRDALWKQMRQMEKDVGELNAEWLRIDRERQLAATDRAARAEQLQRIATERIRLNGLEQATGKNG